MSDEKTTSWHVYMLKCADTSLYTGIAKDLNARLQQHNAGKGAKYTRNRLPVTLAYSEPAVDRSQASKREYQLKQLTRSQKLALVTSG